ncbi:GNAT family N-acetyltransferase [Leucobacter sp. G161]|uniref:GNAT family N-acetyltransferase n=1 Tax=Leucobacter sp. G161 TaxID=663704 RepID=UPI00073D07DD|nr:GNAT family N-acetyltransferase [Leucobacter sp. G161]KUF06310.1 hypothetical protein AUL38_14015 [Leucobacter sp. G161]
MILRSFTHDDAPALTTLLHRAYAELGEAGLNFTAVDQDEGTTLRRASGGQTWVIEEEGALVAALTVSWPAEDALQELSSAAREPNRAWLNQLAVDPDHRGKGYARQLRDVGVDWCVAQGATSIGLDAARPAAHLVALYAAWDFVEAESIQWPGKTYASIVMTRAFGSE